MTPSLYAAYLKERTDDEVLETDTGFAVYRFTTPNTCYIVDIYVHPNFRKSQIASAMADQIVNIAKEKGCTSLIGSVVPSKKNSTTSLKVLLGYDMILDSSANDFIVFRKDI